MAAKKLDLPIRQGETFRRVIRWEEPPIIYKAITAITRGAPVLITAPGHGLVTGWRAAVVSVQGMTEINARYAPPRDPDYRQVTVVDADNVSINDINSAEFSDYESGGYLQFYTPRDLTGYTARMTVKDRIGGDALLTLTSGAPDNRIVIDVPNHTITLTIVAADTAALDFSNAVYDFEMVSASDEPVTTLYYGRVKVSKEVTT